MTDLRDEAALQLDMKIMTDLDEAALQLDMRRLMTDLRDEAALQLDMEKAHD